MPPILLFPAPAAPLPGEAAMLAAVAADLSDDTPKLIYADWLEERGDPRGPFLRAVVAAAAGKGPLPDSSRFPKPWRDLCGVTLREGIPRLHLDYRRDVILKLARPTVGVTTARARESALPVGASKFGGRPDLPPGVAWPTRDKGPLGFAAQFDLADLAGTLAGRDLPPAGVLSFFVYNDPDTGEAGEGDGHRVLYFPDPAGLVRQDPPAGIERWNVAPACRVAFVEGLDLPYAESPWAGELKLGTKFLARDRAARQEYPGWAGASDAEFGRWRRQDEYSDLADLLDDGAPGHHLLGYTRPYVVSGDPVPGPDWRHLLTLTSDDNLKWCWGGGDHLSWYVPAADLKKRRFDRVRVIGT